MRTRFAAFVAVGLMASACTDANVDPAPTPTNTPSTTVTTPSTSAPPSPTPSRNGPLTTGPGVKPGEQPPVLDAVGKQHTKTGAEDFAVYYYRALDWSFATNDSYLLASISDHSCTACAKVIKGLADLRRTGQSLRGGRIQVLGVSPSTASFQLKADYVFDVRVRQSLALADSPSSSPSTASPQSTYHSFVFVVWADTGWKIREES